MDLDVYVKTYCYSAIIADIKWYRNTAFTLRKNIFGFQF